MSKPSTTIPPTATPAPAPAESVLSFRCCGVDVVLGLLVDVVLVLLVDAVPALLLDDVGKWVGCAIGLERVRPMELRAILALP